jgi:hypothetical protein
MSANAARAALRQGGRLWQLWRAPKTNARGPDLVAKFAFGYVINSLLERKWN